LPKIAHIAHSVDICCRLPSPGDWIYRYANAISLIFGHADASFTPRQLTLLFISRRITMIKITLLSALLGTLACAGAMAAGTAPSARVVGSTAALPDTAQTAPSALDDLLTRRKPRVKGGSGCDDPDDLIEHPECRPNITTIEEQQARRKPRVKGGSGCDDPDDLIEHPECRPNSLEIKLPS
jgi:hypothetical protein